MKRETVEVYTHSAQLVAERQWGIGHALLASLRDCVFASAVPLYDVVGAKT